MIDDLRFLVYSMTWERGRTWVKIFKDTMTFSLALMGLMLLLKYYCDTNPLWLWSFIPPLVYYIWLYVLGPFHSVKQAAKAEGKDVWTWINDHTEI